MAHGDPKRVVGAYLTKVEEGEEKLLAETTARALEGASRRGPDGAEGAAGQETPADAIEHPADRTSNMFQATEGRWGSREIEITDVALLDRDGQPSFVFHSGDPIADPRGAPRAATGATTSSSAIGLFNADGVCCYGTNTISGEAGASAAGR